MDNIIEVECPSCHASLWVDTERREVVQHKKSPKKIHSSLEELLNKEKEKKEKFDERFIQADQLAKAKKKKAEELFEKSLTEKP